MIANDFMSRIGGWHGRAYPYAESAQRLPGVELMAVAAAREGRAEEVGTRLGVAYGSYADLFARDGVDAIVLAARSVDHGPLAVEVLRSGKHLFLEKPGATSLVEHDTLRLESSARPGQLVQVGYMRRYDAGFVEAHRRVRAGEGGDPPRHPAHKPGHREAAGRGPTRHRGFSARHGVT